jgi:peroxiredoxin
MSIAIGDSIPDVQVFIMRDGTPAAVSTLEILGEGRVVLFAVPGAFTPGCSQQHLPGYAERADDLAGKGVDRIVCIAVNDVFVMDAWGRDHGVSDTFTMAADGDASFARAMGTDVDVPGLGTRTRRYALVAEDGVVTALMPEPDGFSVVDSTAECVLATL